MPIVSLDQTKNLLTNLPPGVRIELTKLPTGEVAVFSEIEMTKTKDQLIREKYGSLMGKPVTVSEAATQHGVPRSTIEKWLERGYIRVVDHDSYPMKVDAADVAYCVEIYNERKGSGITGVPLLDENGLPYELKHPKLSEYRRRKKSD